MTLVVLATVIGTLLVQRCEFVSPPDITFRYAYFYMAPFSINVGMLVYLMTVAHSLNSENLSKAEAFLDLSIVNGCGDSLTEIPEERVLMYLQESNDVMRGIIAATVVFFIQYGIVLLAALYVKSKYFSRN